MEDRIVEARQTKRHRLSANLCFLSRHKPWPGSKYALVGQKIVFYQWAKMSNNFQPFAREIVKHPEFQEEEKTSSVSQLYMCSWIERLSILSGLNQFS